MEMAIKHGCRKYKAREYNDHNNDKRSATAYINTNTITSTTSMIKVKVSMIGNLFDFVVIGIIQHL